MKIHEDDIIKSIDLNIVGTCNVVKACSLFNVKLVYFSTCYVYPGKKGNYKEIFDPLFPANNYAWSKIRRGVSGTIIQKLFNTKN